MSSEKEKILTVNLSKALRAPLKIRAKKAVKLVREYVARALKIKEVVLDSNLNEVIWRHSISKPPRKIKIKVEVEEETAKVSLAEKT
ncbi:MAG: 50S ribosomal protein L31e [Candidatus Brockarchaeota archaeon]|nr:50S ribosomal protein L31e [Candidatus Brockarchaeota archaeon]MBO3768233.1 50S ribosomal protein L31e [Candidatus Brockarchaeota archaeon]